jgi:predicted PurR-regulated permease PerM
MVKIHPLAIILVLAVGAAIAGIAGAVVAVPITAALVRAWPYLQGRAPPPAGTGADQPGEAPQRR